MRHLTLWTLLLAASSVIGGMAGGCAGPAGVDYLARSRQVGTRTVEWRETQRFDFAEAGEVPASWLMPEGEWRIENGELVATGGERNRVILIAPWETDPIRLEFDALCEAAEGGRIGDITVLLNAAADKRFFSSGYALTAASYYNSCATFYRLGRPLAKTEHTPVRPGRRHRVVVELVHGHIRYWLDGVLVLEAWDPEPLVPEVERNVGLRTWNTRLHIDNLVISEPRSPVPTSAPGGRSYDCVRRAGPVRIDGRLDEDTWRTATWLTVDHAVTGDDPESTRVCLVWDDAALYAAAKLKDDHLTATHRERDSRIWREECLEFFLDPQARGRLYYEVNVNALGTVYDALNIVDSGLHRTVMERAWNPAQARAAALRTREGWQLEMRLPFTDMPTAVHVPPLPGDIWRANIFRVDARADGSIVNAAWSPTAAFHDTKRFGTWRFVYPERTARQNARFAAAEALTADPGRAFSRPLAARIAEASVVTESGAALTFDGEHSRWRGVGGRAFLALDGESDVPGIMKACLNRQAMRVSWSVTSPTRLALLAHLYPKAVRSLHRGKADGVVLHLNAPGAAAPVEMLVNSSRRQLVYLDVPKSGEVSLKISPGPAGNDVMDKVFFGLYEVRGVR